MVKISGSWRKFPDPGENFRRLRRRKPNLDVQGPVGIVSISNDRKWRKTAKNRREPAAAAAEHKVHVSRKQYGVKMNWLFYVIGRISKAFRGPILG
jgi:hypothetical protein